MRGACPVAGRLALRDLSRYRSRSGAALAAIALTLGISVAHRRDSGGGREQHGSRQPVADTARWCTPPTTRRSRCSTRATIEHAQQGVDALAAALPGATATRLDVAVDPKAEPIPELGGRPAISLGRRVSGGLGYAGSVYVASPALLSAYGLHASDLAGKDIVTTESGELSRSWVRRPVDRPDRPARARRAARLIGRSARDVLLAAEGTHHRGPAR